MYTPSSGPLLSSSLSCLRTSEWSTMSSSAQFSLACLLHTSCRLAVRKPCGLKKPVSQKASGRLLCSQLDSCSWRERMFTHHSPMLGITSCETFCQSSGTRAMKSASSICASSADMTMVPAIASLRLTSIRRTMAMTFCSRSTSCERQMLSGRPMPPIALICWFTSSRTKSGGSFNCRSSACLRTISSRVRPPPPPDSFGCTLRIVSSTIFVCIVRYARSALV
mmetsp:Transcript_4252/g.11009  ORF Transcript_4252/g.11009 Transcript_4252/m.11009 type:complete len:223 (-) Transcript_4252:162-830(-)